MLAGILFVNTDEMLCNVGILKERNDKQVGMEFICIEELVPKDYLLRKIDRVIDFVETKPMVSSAPTMDVWQWN